MVKIDVHPWAVEKMESNDRVIVANMIGFLSNFIPDLTTGFVVSQTPLINNFKNAVESSTVEFFAHFPGNDKHEESFSCGSSTVLLGTLLKCSEPKIPVILSDEDSTGARILNKALVNLLPGIKALTDDSLLLSIGGDEDEGKLQLQLKMHY